MYVVYLDRHPIAAFDGYVDARVEMLNLISCLKAAGEDAPEEFVCVEEAKSNA